MKGTLNKCHSPNIKVASTRQKHSGKLIQIKTSCSFLLTRAADHKIIMKSKTSDYLPSINGKPPEEKKKESPQLLFVPLIILLFAHFEILYFEYSTINRQHYEYSSLFLLYECQRRGPS